MTDVCEFCGKPDGTTGGSLTVVNEGDCDCADWALAHARQIGHLRRKYVEAKREARIALEAAANSGEPYAYNSPPWRKHGAADWRAKVAERALLALFAEEP